MTDWHRIFGLALTDLFTPFQLPSGIGKGCLHATTIFRCRDSGTNRRTADGVSSRRFGQSGQIQFTDV